MEITDTQEKMKKQKFFLIFNIALMISSFIIALVALPYEIFFIVAVIILFALRDVEKDIKKLNPKRFPFLTGQK